VPLGGVAWLPAPLLHVPMRTDMTERLAPGPGLADGTVDAGAVAVQVQLAVPMASLFPF
jgi:hypothetical protein